MRLGVQDLLVPSLSSPNRSAKSNASASRSATPTYRPGLRLHPCASISSIVATLQRPGTSTYSPSGKWFCHQFCAVVLVFRRFVSIQPRNVGQELNLLGRELPMRSIYLLVNMTGIDEQHLIRPFTLPFGLVEEPEGAGESNGIEEIGGDTHHHIDRAGLDNLPADLQFRGTGIGGGVRHDKARPSGGIECAEEELNPKIVGVVCAGHTERESWVIP